MYKFEIKNNFYLNDSEFKIISGALHYFRVLPEYWEDRLNKLKELGCNTVETYIPWNIHETEENQFEFEGNKDIAKFITIAESLGLFVILRPTPYICAEWDFGGLPYWLLNKPNIRLRDNCDVFLSYVDKYFDKLFKIISKFQITNNGPVIMMQIENEYGSFGNNKKYLHSIKDLMIKHGATVPLFTSDGGWEEALEAGYIPNSNVLPTVNFGSRTEEQFGNLKTFLENKTLKLPLMCMEFWIGWFNNWGGELKRRDSSDAAMELDKILSMGSVNIYMFHGGTNFGFFNGCSYHDGIDPQTTSYDYDALLTEWGDRTEKFKEFKTVISKYISDTPIEYKDSIKKVEYGEVKLSSKVSLFSTIDKLVNPIYNDNTLNMEALNQGYGYILYRSKVQGKKNLDNFKLIGMDDRAHVYVNEALHSIHYKESFIGKNNSISFAKDENTLDILVENMGRINYGASLLSPSQRKGIKGGVLLDIHFHSGWEHYSLDFKDISKIDYSLEYKENTPSFYKYDFVAEEIGDTFLWLKDFGKGLVFINGFNLGRFWDIGPTNYIYIPAPLIKNGKNSIEIFETEGKYSPTIYLSNNPLFK